MTTAPTTADFAKTVNAVGIGSSVWLERPVQILNKIKASVGLKINQNSSLQESAFLSYSNHRRASNPTTKKNMKTAQIKKEIVNLAANLKSVGLENIRQSKMDNGKVYLVIRVWHMAGEKTSSERRTRQQNWDAFKDGITKLMVAKFGAEPCSTSGWGYDNEFSCFIQEAK